jgi:hypothetical protein
VDSDAKPLPESPFYEWSVAKSAVFGQSKGISNISESHM